MYIKGMICKIKGTNKHVFTGGIVPLHEALKLKALYESMGHTIYLGSRVKKTYMGVSI